MKLKNLSIATIILLLIGIGFSSCEEDRYRWETSTLVYDSFSWEPPMVLDSRGRMSFDFDLDIRDIPTGYNDDISDIRLFDSYFLLASNNFRPYNNVQIFLSANNRTYEGYMKMDRNDFIVDINDPNYEDFVADLLYDLNRRKRLTLYVDIRTNIMQSAPVIVDFKFFNNIDIEVRR